MTSPRHQGTAHVCGVLLYLLKRGDSASTRQIAEAVGSHRDTTRRILQELAGRGWAHHHPHDDGDRWSLGPELPRLGLIYQEQLNARAARLRSDFQRLTTPFFGEDS